MRMGEDFSEPEKSIAASWPPGSMTFATGSARVSRMPKGAVMRSMMLLRCSALLNLWVLPPVRTFFLRQNLVPLKQGISISDLAGIQLSAIILATDTIHIRLLN